MHKTTVRLRIREKADVKSKQIGLLEQGAEVELSTKRNDFGKLKGQPGWVMLRWLEEVPEPEPAEE